MIDYKVNEPISVKQFIELLNKTTLGARRPLEDEKRVAAMLHYADLLVTAWDGERLVGVARSVTDFAYCCYLSDLAVDEQYQKQGIGLQLIEHTKNKPYIHKPKSCFYRLRKPWIIIRILDLRSI